MPVTDCIEVTAGASTWYRALHLLMLAAGGLAIAVAEAAPVWKFALSIGMLGVFARLWWSLAKCHQRTTLKLFYDGSAAIGRPGDVALQGETGWASRWVCIVPISETVGASARQFLVCASNNRADDYRRLLRWLRLRNSADPNRSVIY